VRPMLATPGGLPEGPQWRYEVMWNGLRVLADATGGTLRLTSCSGHDVTGRFPEIAELADRADDGLFDGELIVLADGVPSHAALADRMHATGRGQARRLAARLPAAMMAFDILRLYGVPLLHRPLDERQATLRRLRVDAAGSVALSPVYDDGRALLSAARRQHLAGVVAKRRDAPYRPGVRDPSWIEVRPAGHIPAAAARASTRSVRSQGTSRSSRPKCP
jgi:bifunctional non-homologous end joining protein LigD